MGTSLPRWGSGHLTTNGSGRARKRQAYSKRICIDSRARDGTTLTATTPQPDPRLGPPGSYRRLDRSSARGHRPADRGVQEGERPRAGRRGRRRAGSGAGGGDFDDEIDLRAEDDALIAAELEAAEAARAEEEARRAEEAAAAAAEAGDDEDDDDEDDDDEDAGKKRRRGRRGGRGRRKGGARRARGDVRPRRGGLRALARSRGRGQPRLRRALGRPPAGQRHDRGEPDRDPPRRRRRRRRLSRAPG